MSKIILFIMINISVAVTVQANPFMDGVERIELNSADRQELKNYIQTSKKLLNDALTESKDRDLETVKNIYESVIKKVVLLSYNNKGRKELIFRMALNQALELTVGIPNQSGGGVVKKGVLTDSKQLDLVTAILETSIKLAIHFIDDDLKVADQGQLIDLPYYKFANLRLNLAMIWSTGLLKITIQNEFYQTLLEQYYITLIRSDNLNIISAAEDILKVEECLEEVKYVSNPIFKNRTFRKSILNLIKDEYKTLVNKKFVGLLDSDKNFESQYKHQGTYDVLGDSYKISLKDSCQPGYIEGITVIVHGGYNYKYCLSYSFVKSKSEYRTSLDNICQRGFVEGVWRSYINENNAKKCLSPHALGTKYKTYHKNSCTQGYVRGVTISDHYNYDYVVCLKAK